MHGSVRTHIHVVCRHTEMHLMHGSVLTNINAGSDVHLMHGSVLTNIQHVVAFNACSYAHVARNLISKGCACMKLHLHARKFINSWMCAHSLMHLCLHMHGAIFEQMELLLGLF